MQSRLKETKMELREQSQLKPGYHLGTEGQRSLETEIEIRNRIR